MHGVGVKVSRIGTASFTVSALSTVALALLISPAVSRAQADEARIIRTERHTVRVETLIQGLHHPWSLAFLPDGRLLISERRGTLRLVDGGRMLPNPVAGLPQVAEHGQGGLLDVALHPDHARNGWIYWAYNAEANGLHGTELARGRLIGPRSAPRLTDVEVLYRMQPKSKERVHFGARIVFDRAGFLYLTLGDRGDDPDLGERQRAQRLDDAAGKVIRLHDDGRIPADNPFLRSSGARPEIFSSGHRNVQGAAIEPRSGALWTHEHGPQGGDEINILVAGANYGWPVITHGVHYGSAAPIGIGTAKAGMRSPLYYWKPSIAPSGMAFYAGRPFPAWQGNLFVGALAGQTLVRLELDGERIVHEERLFTRQIGRIRDVRIGPDGLIYLLTDAAQGALLRLAPAR